MRWLGSTRRTLTYGTAGALAGGLTAVATIWIAAAAIAQSAPVAGAVLDVTHSPMLLRAPGDVPRLVYDAHCAVAGVEDPEAGCDLRGAVFVRAAGTRSFRELPLERAMEGGARLVTVLPDDLLEAAALEYYAVVTSPETGASVTVPSGGAAAPAVSRLIEGAIAVRLGRHPFGSQRLSGERVAAARWGTGPREIGLEGGRSSNPIGASAFDVDAAGSVVVLDHAGRKLLRWGRKGRVREVTPLSVNGTIADLAAAPDGSFYVLETTSRDGRNPLVRRFDDAGRELEAIETAEPGPAQLAIGPEGPLVLQRPSHQWMPALVSGVPAAPATQRSRARHARRLPSGAEVVVQRIGNELRVALLNGGSISRSWRITSDTALGEVQVAEPVGPRFVVVVRVYTDTTDELAVLVLDRDGLRSRGTIPTAEWAEGAPFGRVRLAGTRLYRLGTSSTGVFVDRFDLEVR